MKILDEASTGAVTVRFICSHNGIGRAHKIAGYVLNPMTPMGLVSGYVAEAAKQGSDPRVFTGTRVPDGRSVMRLPCKRCRLDPQIREERFTELLWHLADEEATARRVVVLDIATDAASFLSSEAF